MIILPRNILVMALMLVLAISGPVQGQDTTPTVSEAAVSAARAAVNGERPLNRVGKGKAGPIISPPPRTIVREAEPITPPPEHRLNVMLDWYLNLYHAPLIVAQERGLFDREGLEVTLTMPADPSVPPKLVAARRTELAITSQPRLHLLVEQGLPLIRVGTLVPLPLNALLVREDSGIGSLSELKGKTIGYALEDQARLLLDGMLASQSVSPKDMKLKRVDFALARSLIQNEVDAVIGAQRHMERRQMAQEGVTAIEFAVEEHGVPLYDEMILIANRDVLKQHHRDIANFLDALQSATVWLINHPEQAWELVRRARPALDTEINARAWPETLRYLALRPGVLQEQRYVRFEAYLQKRGLIEALTPVKRLAVELGSSP
ncbi:putative hydroxymethylpyrimidine transport system substrate-binding protein [Modicisalibacter muralis]|uniref:Putative hydroxymethylpyrimidine transport system substrate-binding protein n=1 Tax=Modicisalibacter muralis TaxID=119000 RepID=A0A1G9GLR7_9GAMM|nr:ABC transporter substrate-binding protein [Halomonas muralis]SDL01445.1 putative hydroxymethylpyrimidine transport system substrate-binding protein [Halomonas muralis]